MAYEVITKQLKLTEHRSSWKLIIKDKKGQWYYS
jgi:hypothetical protein